METIHWIYKIRRLEKMSFQFNFLIYVCNFNFNVNVIFTDCKATRMLRLISIKIKTGTSPYNYVHSDVRWMNIIVKTFSLKTMINICCMEFLTSRVLIHACLSWRGVGLIINNNYHFQVFKKFCFIFFTYRIKNE